MTNLERLEKDIRSMVPRLKAISHPLDYPILLSDVLERLSTISEYQDQYCIDSKGYFLDYVEQEGNYVLCSNCKWDLSKPYLKDQSQELIDYLATLI